MRIEVEDYPDVALYFYSHYRVKASRSLRPVFTSKSMHFPKYYSIERRRISIIDKLKFYVKDFKLWMEVLRHWR
jgi:hypothetical protein